MWFLHGCYVHDLLLILGHYGVYMWFLCNCYRVFIGLICDCGCYVIAMCLLCFVAIWLLCGCYGVDM